MTGNMTGVFFVPFEVVDLHLWPLGILYMYIQKMSTSFAARLAGGTVPAGVLLVFRSREAMREVEKSLGRKRSDIRYVLIKSRNAAHTVPIADHLAKRFGIPQVLVYDAENLNAAARMAVLRQVNQMDFKIRADFQRLLDGDMELSDIQDAGARMALTAEIFRLLPRIAPTSLAERQMYTPEVYSGGAAAESALRAVRLQMFHPSFGDALKALDVVHPEQPRAAVWTLETILADPFFFDTMDDRNRKIKGRMTLDDHVIVGPGVDIERALGERYEIFKGHFSDERIHRTRNTSTHALYELLGGNYRAENILFVDKDAGRSLRQETTEDKSLKLLVVQGPYSLNLDKVVVRILARGGSTEPIIISGLTREGNFFLFTPIVPIDFLRHLKRYFETTIQLGHAA